MRREKREEKKYEKKQRRQRGREIFVAGYLMVGLFCLMAIYFLVFEISGKNDVLVNPLNNRTRNMAQSVRKGDIVTGDGVVVATTQNAEDGSEYRYYPFGSLFVHTVGYETKGGAGLERSQAVRLLISHSAFPEQLRTELLNQKKKGDTLHITLDYRMQQFCYDQLGGRNGAIIVTQPGTGRILAMVSAPDFNAATVDADWSSLISEENRSGNMMNRASQGLYAPGSTFKLITLLEYIRENPDTWQDFSYTCGGFYTYGEQVVNCHGGHAHGEVDIYGALAQSCNGAFITMGLTLDPERWRELGEDFGYNQSETLEIQYKKSSFSVTEETDEWNRLQAAIGQGTTVATPLQVHLITSAIANGGEMMKPYLIDGFESADHTYAKWASGEVMRSCISKEEADLLTEFMIGTVRDGSGSQGGSSYCQVAGKTGSAQYSSEAGRYHAWFTGFAPAEDPQLAVTVLIEDGGAGGEVAAPVAGRIFDYYFSLMQAAG